MAALCAVAVLSAGCDTVWTRGLVQDADGASIPGASVRVLDDRGAKPVPDTTTGRNGCFMLGPVAARGRRHLELEIIAPGYETSGLRLRSADADPVREAASRVCRSAERDSAGDLWRARDEVGAALRPADAARGRTTQSLSGEPGLAGC